MAHLVGAGAHAVGVWTWHVGGMGEAAGEDEGEDGGEVGEGGEDYKGADEC